jgi:hypothetical protein
MRKIAMLALAMTCLSAPALSQQAAAPGVQAAPAITGTVPTQQAVPAAPNPVNPGGTAPTQAAPSVTGGVPNQ